MRRPKPCPECGHTGKHRAFCDQRPDDPAFLAKFQSVALVGLGRYSSWGSGKVMFQLPPGHPDRIVGSEKEARAVARKHGISEETGQFKSEALRHKAEGSRRERAKMGKNRVSISPETFGRKLRGP